MSDAFSHSVTDWIEQFKDEDLFASAFLPLCDGVIAGRFDKLHSRENFWSLLVATTSTKAIDCVRRKTAQKRGVGEVRGHSIFVGGDGSASGIERVISREPTPEFLVQIDEEHRRVLELLRDDLQQEIIGYRLVGHSNEEIAVKTGVLLRSVERRLKVIRDAWTKELGE